MRTNRILAAFVGVFLMVCSSRAAAAADSPVTFKEEAVSGQTSYRLENYRVNLLIVPARGGAVTSYRDKLAGNVELIRPEQYYGLCLDHFQAQNWPGELLEVPYEAKVIKNDPSECQVQVTRAATGKWSGSEFPEIAGVVLEKTYTLRADSPALECRVKLTAPPKAAKLLAYWNQSIFFAGGTYDGLDDRSFRPSTRGVRVKSRDQQGFTGPESWVNDFSAGWMALIDRKLKNGLVFLTHYDDLKSLYVCSGNQTVEPMFQITYLPAGKSAEFVVQVVPVTGLDNVVAATDDFVAGYSLQEDHQGSGKIAFSVVRSAAVPSPLALSAAIRNVDNPSLSVKAGAFPVVNLTDAVQTVAAAFTGAGHDPLILAGSGKTKTAAGEEHAFPFEDFLTGAYRWGENINTDMATPYWVAPRPDQKLKLQKPANLELRRPGEHNVWFVDGLLDDYYQITCATRLVVREEPPTSPRVKKHAFTVAQGGFGMKLTSFPYDYEELLTCNYMVIGGVSAEALSALGVEMLADYASAGGGFIFLGGPNAFGESRLDGTKLKEVMPVKIKGAFDLKPLDGNPKLEVASDAPFLQDLDWKTAPRVRFIHDVEVKPDAKAVLTAGGKPFLVIGEYGPRKARVACILGAPMGAMGKGETPFWKWQDWSYLLRQVIWWVARRDDQFE